jgi:hypothetical protein
MIVTALDFAGAIAVDERTQAGPVPAEQLTTDLDKVHDQLLELAKAIEQTYNTVASQRDIGASRGRLPG